METSFPFYSLKKIHFGKTILVGWLFCSTIQKPIPRISRTNNCFHPTPPNMLLIFSLYFCINSENAQNCFVKGWNSTIWRNSLVPLILAVPIITTFYHMMLKVPRILFMYTVIISINLLLLIVAARALSNQHWRKYSAGL